MSYEKVKSALGAAIKTIDSEYASDCWRVKARSTSSGEILLLNTGHHFKTLAEGWCARNSFEVIEWFRPEDTSQRPRSSSRLQVCLS